MSLWDVVKEGLSYITPLGHLGNKTVTDIPEMAPQVIKGATQSVVSSNTGKVLILGAVLVGAVLILKNNN